MSGSALKRVVCDGTCKRGVCGCGAFVDGVLQDGVLSVSVPMMFMDSAERPARDVKPIRDANPEPADRAHARVEAAFDHYVDQMGMAWQSDRPAAAPATAADEYAEMCRRMNDAWRSD